MLSAAPVTGDRSDTGAHNTTRRRRVATNTSHVSELMYAAQQGDVHKVRKIIRDQPTSLYYKDRTGKSPLHYCCTSDNLCAAQAADLMVMAAPELVDSRDEDGFTPLHLAVIAGNMPLVTFLLANGADVNALDNEQHTVVHWATVCGETAALRAVLAAGAPVSTPDVHGGYPLHYAAQMCGGDKENNIGLQVLQALLGQSDIQVSVEDGDGRQPLLWAASAGSAKAMLALIRAGAAVEASDKDGLTALHCAASRGHTDCIDTLLTLCGASPDVIDSNGCTALHYAVTLGHADATALLLAHGANPNRRDRKGRTPAHCGCAKGQFETLKLISAHDANLWLRNARGDLPLHEAAASGRRELVKWLLEMRPSQVNARNNDGRCPIHLAALHDNPDMCKILLDAAAQINPILRTSKNVFMTPLDCALQRGFRSTAKYLQLHGGVPASRLGEMGYKPSRDSAVNLQIRDDITFWGDTSSDSERENGEKEKHTKKTIRKKLAYKYDRKRTLSGSDLENKLSSAKAKGSKSKRKFEEKLRNGRKYDNEAKPTDSSKKQGQRKSSSSRLDYSNEIVINGKTEVNIHQTSEINISSGVEEAVKQKSQTTLEVPQQSPPKKESAKENEKDRRPKSAKYSKVSAKSKKHSDKESSARRKKTPDISTSQDKNNISEKKVPVKRNDVEVKDQSTNTSDETSNEADTIVERSVTKANVTTNGLPTSDVSQEIQKSDNLADKQSIMSNTSEDVEENKNIVVQASVHDPPKEYEQTNKQEGEEILQNKNTKQKIESRSESLRPTERLKKQKSIRQSPDDITENEIELQNGKEEKTEAKNESETTAQATAAKTNQEITTGDRKSTNIEDENQEEADVHPLIEEGGKNDSKDVSGTEMLDTNVMDKDDKVLVTEEKDVAVTTNEVKVDNQHKELDQQTANEAVINKDDILTEANQQTLSAQTQEKAAYDSSEVVDATVKEQNNISESKLALEADTTTTKDVFVAKDTTEEKDSSKAKEAADAPTIKDISETIGKDTLSDVAKAATSEVVTTVLEQKDETAIEITEELQSELKTATGNKTSKASPEETIEIKEVDNIEKSKTDIKQADVNEKEENMDGTKQKEIRPKDFRKGKKQKVTNKSDVSNNITKSKQTDSDTLKRHKAKATVKIDKQADGTKKCTKEKTKPSEKEAEANKHSEDEAQASSSENSESQSSSTPTTHKSFRVLDDEEAKLLDKAASKKQSKKGHLAKQRSRSEENKTTEDGTTEKLKRSKIPKPLTKTHISKSDKQLYEPEKKIQSNLDARVPSLPNIHKGDSKGEDSQAGSPYSDNERSASDYEELRRSSSLRRKRVKRRSKPREARSAGSDYESSNLIDSGFEPSPRSTRIPKWRNMSERGVNMTSVTQSIQSNVRRYHLERKIFEQLLELKRLQIRAGQHNESLLVKRAIDAYHQSCASTVGAGKYLPEDYTFKSFEKFLYHALRKLQKNGAEHLKGLPEPPTNPLLCTQSTHRCMHATHAYTGVPCAAYLPKMDHHTIPKIGFNSSTACRPGTGPSFLPSIGSKKAVTLELCHGADKQVISLPADRLDQNKRYYVTFTVKGHEPHTPPNEERPPSDSAHQHPKSD